MSLKERGQDRQVFQMTIHSSPDISALFTPLPTYGAFGTLGTFGTLGAFGAFDVFGPLTDDCESGGDVPLLGCMVTRDALGETTEPVAWRGCN